MEDWNKVWRESVELCNKGDKLRKGDRYEEALDCYERSLKGLKTVLAVAQEDGWQPRIALLNYEIGVCLAHLGEACLMIGDVDAALVRLREVGPRIRESLVNAAGETRQDWEEKHATAEKRFGEVKVIRQRVMDALSRINDPIARKASELYGRYFMRLPLKEAERRNRFPDEFLAACMEAYFHDSEPSATERDEFSNFIIKNGEEIMRVGLEISGIIWGAK